MNTLDLKIYKIAKFGYFSRHQGAPPLGEFSDIITNLRTWIAGKNVVKNCTHCDSDAAGSEKTLCVSIVNSPVNNDFLITLWVGIDVGDGNSVGAIAANTVPGDDGVDIEENDFSVDSVPGYPVYFYVMADLGVLAPVKINGSKNGIVNLKRYFDGFLERYSKYVHYEMDERRNRKLKFYGNDSDENLNYYPIFKYSNWQRKDVREYISERRERIKKIIKIDHLVRAQERNSVSRFLGFGSAQGDNRLNGVKFKYELDFTPTEEELQHIFENHDSDDESRETEYGFKIDTDVHWLSHSIQKHRFTTELRRRNATLFSANSILTYLTSVRQHIINALSEDEDEEVEEGDE